MPRYYSVYLNTKTASGPLKPDNKSNLANVTFSVNWNTVFPTSTNFTRLINNNAKCILRAHLVSEVGALTWANNKGTLRISGIGSSSQYSLGTGVILGITKPQDDPVGATFYHELDTTQGVGQEISIPTQSTICVCFVKDDGVTLQTNVPEYELLLQFELEDNDAENLILG